MALPLFESYPGTAALSLAGIAELPTPVEELGSRLSEASSDFRFPGGRVYVKRDDLTSPRYGGNKVRKLDFLLGDAVAAGARAVLTFGAYGSNHALATAVHARALGLEPHAVLSPQEPSPFAPRTLLAHAALGTVIHLVEGWDGRREAVLARRAVTERDGVEPYVIPMGGSCPVGVAGYVNGALEVLAQAEAGEMPPPDVVYVAGGTLGTAVGLAMGFAAAGTHTRVEAVRVTPLELADDATADRLTAGAVELLRGMDQSFPALQLADLNLELRHEFFEPGYGVPTPETREAVAVARTAGIELETTYTGKAFSALRHDLDTGRLDAQEHAVLFWDTYNSAPYPPPGDEATLPAELQRYIAECRSLFGEAGVPR